MWEKGIEEERGWEFLLPLARVDGAVSDWRRMEEPVGPVVRRASSLSSAPGTM